MAKQNKRTFSKKFDDPIYLPISLPRYKRNKILILKTALLIINCIKITERINELKTEKDKLINELRRLLNFSYSQTNNLEGDFPVIQNKSEMRKTRMTQRITIEREISLEDSSLPTENIKSSKLSSLDKELEEIKQALTKLGSSEI